MTKTKATKAAIDRAKVLETLRGALEPAVTWVTRPQFKNHGSPKQLDARYASILRYLSSLAYPGNLRAADPALVQRDELRVIIMRGEVAHRVARMGGVLVTLIDIVTERLLDSPAMWVTPSAAAMLWWCETTGIYGALWAGQLIADNCGTDALREVLALSIAHCA